MLSRRGAWHETGCSASHVEELTHAADQTAQSGEHAVRRIDEGRGRSRDVPAVETIGRSSQADGVNRNCRVRAGVTVVIPRV